MIRTIAHAPPTLGWRFLTLLLSGAAAGQAPEPLLTAPEARQGVAVDAEALYVIDNQYIGKYDKRDGTRLGHWDGRDGKRIQHLNSGVVIDGRLYCAHSNYPDTPMVSSIEIWDSGSLTHVGSHSFGIYAGSATWVDYYDDSWWVMFAHYAGRGGEPGKGPEWSTLIRFDPRWQRQAAFTLPDELVDTFAPYSNSGGAWGDDGLLYLSGHDGAWLYVVELPDAGSELVYRTRVPAEIDGQGIAWDRSTSTRDLYGLVRDSNTVHRSRIPAIRTSLLQ